MSQQEAITYDEWHDSVCPEPILCRAPVYGDVYCIRHDRQEHGNESSS